MFSTRICDRIHLLAVVAFAVYVGYEFTLRNGQLQVLPSNTVLTRASDEIDRALAARLIPVNKRRIPIRR
jgi:hypothetical protein